MAETDKFMVEMLRSIQSAVAETNRRLEKMESNISGVERRQTASHHFEQSVLAHLASIHSSMDDLKADMRAVRGEMRDVHNRLERVEAR